VTPPADDGRLDDDRAVKAVADTQRFDSGGVGMVRAAPAADATLDVLEDGTRLLVRLSAAVCSGSEAQLRVALADAAAGVDPVWIEELVLQSYLFAGLPRALNAAREWRRISGRRAPRADDDAQYDHVDEWRERGEATCETVYGRFYERLRHNIAELHPALDAWMIVEGYGKVLGRPGLDLRRRELCVVAACAALGQDRQLHSHLHGAMHAGASHAEISATLDAVADFLTPAERKRFAMLWARVRAH
jgi:4-carboxymuconolactone decarboxylase